MLVIYRDDTILTSLKAATPDELEAHIRAGYPDLLPDYEAGTLKAVEVDDAADPSTLTVDKGAIRPLTPEERDARKATAPDPAIEAAIAAEIRASAIERLKSRGQQIPEGYR